MTSAMLTAPDGRPADNFTECRVYERHPCAVPTACQPAGGNEMRWQAVIQNVSLGGVRVSLTRRFERNSVLALELPGGAAPRTAWDRWAKWHLIPSGRSKMPNDARRCGPRSLASPRRVLPSLPCATAG